MPPSFRVAPNFARRWIVCCAVFFATVAAGTIAFADVARHSAKLPLAFMMADGKTAAANEPAAKSPAKKTDDKKTDNEEEKKRKRAIAEYAFYLVWGLAAVFALLLLMVILWGNRLRRETRTNPAKATKLDPLWYLRKPGTRTAEKTDESKPNGDSD